MKSFIYTLFITFSFAVFAQESSNKVQIETTLNNYIDGFYKGDTLKLKEALKPRLYKFGYWKNKDTGKYEYSSKMTFKKAIEYSENVLKKNRMQPNNAIRKVEILDIGNHIASAKITAWWGIDYILLSKESGKWMIEQVIWEGPLQKKEEQKTTTYYLIRHAEKDRSDKTNRNPHLTDAGKKRAENWTDVLKAIEFDMVYSTDYNRTKETAIPTAKVNNIELSLYNPRNMNVKEFMANTKGKTVLIVGHSNTTPMFTNSLLGNKKYDMIADNNNANLYIVTITKDSKISMLLNINSF